MGRIVRDCIGEIADTRPFLDTEHGPIHRFKDKRRTLPEDFDDEYFRHMSWAHLASGGFGGGMRWPNRHPHVLTPGMRVAQRAMARFLPLVDWQWFRRQPLVAKAPGFHAFTCGDREQAVVWLLRRGGCAGDGRIDAALVTPQQRVTVPMPPGCYRIAGWDTRTGVRTEIQTGVADEDRGLRFFAPAIGADRAFAVRRID